jgi:uncharacterized delta-60 repeat protein
VVWPVAAVGLGVLILSPAAASGGQTGRSVAHLPLAGNLDRSFGGGFVTHSFGGSESYPSIEGIAVQPDRKIVVTIHSPRGDLLLARYLPNGSLDQSFGNGGYAEPQLSYHAFARAVALQPDGKIIVAGVSQPDGDSILGEFMLARFNPDGSLDTTFGTNGIKNTVIPKSSGTYPDARANAVAVLPSGQILAAGGAAYLDGGDTHLSSFALVRYTPDGSLDPTFGDGGIVQTAFIGQDTLAGIAVQPDGKIVASGTGGLLGHGTDVETIALARYEPDGSLDSTFGTAGKVTTPPKFSYFGGPTTLDGGPPTLQHGKIVVAASHAGETSAFLVIARYDGTGRLDSTFGKHGFAKIRGVTASISEDGIRTPSAVVTQNDGKILIPAINSVLRLQPNGQLDPSFGRGGIVSIRDRISSLALQAGQKILVGGARGHAWTLARLLGGNNCVVPKLRGKTVSEARKKLKTWYCRTGRISRLFSNRVAKGHVISTAAPLGDRLPGGTKVDLAVSRGKPTQRP